jgi:hypothetical protein
MRAFLCRPQPKRAARSSRRPWALASPPETVAHSPLSRQLGSAESSAHWRLLRRRPVEVRLPFGVPPRTPHWLKKSAAPQPPPPCPRAAPAPTPLASPADRALRSGSKPSKRLSNQSAWPSRQRVLQGVGHSLAPPPPGPGLSRTGAASEQTPRNPRRMPRPVKVPPRSAVFHPPSGF